MLILGQTNEIVYIPFELLGIREDMYEKIDLSRGMITAHIWPWEDISETQKSKVAVANLQWQTMFQHLLMLQQRTKEIIDLYIVSTPRWELSYERDDEIEGDDIHFFDTPEGKRRGNNK